MPYRYFDLTLEERVAHLKLNRPEQMNTMSPAFFAELETIVNRLHCEAVARVLVLSSTGKHFSAGMALDVFSGSDFMLEGTAAGRVNLRESLLTAQASFTALERLRMPVIAAIQGGCIGGGVDLVLACDVRYCAQDAFFCIQEINIGLVADLGTLQRLPKLIPEGVAREYAYSGRRMPAARARELGLANEVYSSHESTIEAALALAAEIAAKSPLAVLGTKQAINYARDHGVAESLEHTALLQAAIFESGTLHEAVAASRAKRAPEFAALLPIPKVAE
jgi:enoyl-CoA hydratase